MQNLSIGFIGAGNMATSLIRGLLNQGVPGGSLFAADIDSDKLTALASECGINAASPEELVNKADVIVLAVKPQVMRAVCSSLARPLAAREVQPLFVSIAAGVSLASLKQWLGGEPAVVRCMPNTPALVGKGATGLFANGAVSDARRSAATLLLDAVGVSVWVESEADLDIVTAVSGSGPAYYFLFMEAMQEAAIEMGMAEDLARLLVLQTAAGAAELAGQSEDSVAELRRKVTSPGGTTEQAILQFESGGLRELVTKALTAARDKSIDLSRAAD